MNIDWSFYLKHICGSWFVPEMSSDISYIGNRPFRLPWVIGTQIVWRYDNTIYTGIVKSIGWGCLFKMQYVPDWNDSDGAIEVLGTHKYSSLEDAETAMKLLDI